MGYRSEVGLVLSKNGVSILHERLKNANLSEEVKNDVCELLQYAHEHYKDKTTGSEVWRWQDTKWYDSLPYYFEEIKFIADTIRDLPEKDYCFIRIGEDCDDVDVWGDYWDNPFDFGLERKIAISPA